MPDNWEQNYENIWMGEVQYNNLPNPITSDADADYDLDGLTNLEEYSHGTNSYGKTLNPANTDGAGRTAGSDGRVEGEALDKEVEV